MFVNGKKVGTIRGYDALSLNITDYLKSGENVLVVGAYDPNDGRAVSGKNGSRGDIFLPPVSGKPFGLNR